MSDQEAWDSRTNLLCVRLDNMGDVLMTTPALRALKEAVPGRKLTLLTSPAGARIAALIPQIDETLDFEVPWVKHSSTERTRGLIPDIVRKLASREFDGAVIFTVFSQNPLPAALLCYLANVPRVLGYCRENPYQLISHWVPDPEPLEMVRHEVDRQLALVESIGARTRDTRLSLVVPKSTELRVRHKLQAIGLDMSSPWLILHAGASEAKREYDLSSFARAARLLEQYGWQIVLTGSRAEAPQTGKLHKKLNHAFDMAGLLTVEELAAAVGLAYVLVSNNTGPVHMASALGTPVVVLYAQTNPQHTPWQVPSQVLYFPVPSGLRSKNRLLQHFSWPESSQASPERIVEAVRTLSRQKGAAWQKLTS